MAVSEGHVHLDFLHVFATAGNIVEALQPGPPPGLRNHPNDLSETMHTPSTNDLLIAIIINDFMF